MPPIPLEPFQLCVFARHRPIEIAYTSISLFFGKPTHAFYVYIISLGSHKVSDLAAFTVIIVFGVTGGLNSSAMSMSRSGIVKTIVQDASIYFVVIFTSHLVFVLTLVFARVGVLRN